MQRALLVSVLILSSCGLVYELLAGTVASYLLGETVTQFSLVIGIYLFSMGIGSWLSRYLIQDLVGKFLEVELALGLLGGSSAAILFLSFGHTKIFQIPLFVLVVCIGILVGMEIPLLLRILQKKLGFRDLVSKVLSLDYAGALIASLTFPIFFAPKIGMVRTSFLFGILNAGTALWGTWILPLTKREKSRFHAKSAIVLTILTIGFAFSDYLTTYSEESLYTDEIILTKQTNFQRIIVTRYKNELRLFLNGHLQFSSRDEYRYHEVLAHPALLAHPNPRKVLVLGGGDGLAVREILKHPTVQSVTLVDLDPEMTKLFSEQPLLTQINQGSLSDPKVKIENADAFLWLEGSTDTFDVVLVDFPDPSNFSIGKLYTTAFYRILKRRLNSFSVVEIQSTSPLFARQSFWCIDATLRESGFYTKPLHVYVPSFGEWGFVLASPRRNLTYRNEIPEGLRFLNTTELFSLSEFPLDMSKVEVESNHLNNQALVRYYDQEWNKLLD
ncbi:spermidine synthase [Leptospira perolatii]|uniref:Polyamine aminopropyltransferase n=1 Tax=Leptospira perolatii TaxID=2023191 RepID=A0A2M9ZLV0_9LEPT|nr:polyamine aminopropyltransferase [Leptospira perolatii]PJZ69796.1 spermidine synthase [Leptospira perolatii]PJZ72989.1 spermidine synthase [Leptospira perolatii]